MHSFSPRWRVVTIGASIAFAATLMAAPVAADEHAGAEADNEISTSFTITDGGQLQISVAPEDTLGEVQFGGQLDAPLGSVEVTDDRSSLEKSWSVWVHASKFIASDVEGTDAVEVLPSQLFYGVGAEAIAGSLIDGGGAMTAQETPLSGGNAVQFTASGGLDGLGLSVLTGNATWNPSITFDTDTTPPGTYTGTVTHSLLP